MLSLLRLLKIFDVNAYFLKFPIENPSEDEGGGGGGESE